jgi:hypothetical protein
VVASGAPALHDQAPFGRRVRRADANLHNRPPAPKAGSAAAVTCEGGDGADRGCFVGCPLGTVQDRSEWHASGTASKG